MTPIPARFNGIDHVVLKVSDMERTVRFYKTVLGLSVERIYEKLGLHQVRCGANLIDLLSLPPGETLPPAAERGIEHLCLSIEADLDAVIQSLAALDVPIIRGPMEVYGSKGFGTSIYIHDPDHYEIELKVGYSVNPVYFPPKAGT